MSTPSKKSLPADDVRSFRDSLKQALRHEDDQGRPWASAACGVYAFYDYDGEPIYVGQTYEQLATRIRRHLTNQRTDAVAMRILDIFEVAEIEMWPVWEFGNETPRSERKSYLDSLEHSAYLHVIEDSRFKAVLNEKLPPESTTIELPPSVRLPLRDEDIRSRLGHSDTRIARRAETISRLAAVAHERGEVSDGLRRVLVIQAVRLTYLASVRLAEAEGRDTPSSTAINVDRLLS